ncbi:alkylation response protein AidB-like acyl-CoA dehydrogenase [Bradyrhizobium sp. F1.13.1]
MNIPSIDFDLGEDIGMLRDTLRAFVEAEIAPRAADIEKANLFPAELWKRLGDLGLLGMTAPEQYGGSNMGYLAHIVAMEEDFARLGRGRSLLRCPFQSLRQPDPP